MTVRFDLSHWEWAKVLFERNDRPDRTAAVICGIGSDGIRG